MKLFNKKGTKKKKIIILGKTQTVLRERDIDAV